MLIWILFLTMILAFLALDLGVFNKNPHIISNKETAIWTTVWVATGLGFSLVIYQIYLHAWVPNPTGLSPGNAMLKFITGYLVELSLSVDNIFVIAVIFNSFRIAQKYQHRVLFWGIIGALVFRALMILFGVLLIEKFDWMAYVFGAFLVYTAIKMLISKEGHSDEEFNPKKSALFRFVKKIIPVTSKSEGEHFFVRRKHILAATPLFIVLILIEFTDILFALDSIPAIIAITTDPFLVFTSNIFAILGLRSMYFFLSNMLGKFSKLKYSLTVILTFVGIKLILKEHYHAPEWLSLGVIALSLVGGIVWSLISTENTKTHPIQH